MRIISLMGKNPQKFFQHPPKKKKKTTKKTSMVLARQNHGRVQHQEGSFQSILFLELGLWGVSG